MLKKFLVVLGLFLVSTWCVGCEAESVNTGDPVVAETADNTANGDFGILEQPIYKDGKWWCQDFNSAGGLTACVKAKGNYHKLTPCVEKKVLHTHLKLKFKNPPTFGGGKKTSFEYHFGGYVSWSNGVCVVGFENNTGWCKNKCVTPGQIATATATVAAAIVANAVSQAGIVASSSTMNSIAAFFVDESWDFIEEGTEL